MNFSEAQISKAKQEAKEILEHSIATLCMLLNVDTSTIVDSYDHDFPEGDAQYSTHESLKRQVANYILILG